MVVYLLSRNDMKTMTAGKEMAQAQHCGVQMVAKYGKHKDVKEYIKQGLAQHADHFNTTITLEASGRKIRNVVSTARKLGYVADLLIDPTYPFWIPKDVAKMLEVDFHMEKDGQVLVTKTEMTFGWLLGDKNDTLFTNLVNGLELKSHNRLIYEEK